MPGTEQEWDQLKQYGGPVFATATEQKDWARILPRFDEVARPEHYNSKRCGTCKEELPTSAFAKNRAKKDGLQDRCKACRAAHYVNSGYSSFAYWKTILRKYNIDIDEYARLLKAQDYRCAICRISFEDSMLVVDHCHETGDVRGLLCNPCNRGLGFFRDDTDALLAAADYVNTERGKV